MSQLSNKKYIVVMFRDTDLDADATFQGRVLLSAELKLGGDFGHNVKFELISFGIRDSYDVSDNPKDYNFNIYNEQTLKSIEESIPIHFIDNPQHFIFQEANRHRTLFDLIFHFKRISKGKIGIDLIKSHYTVDDVLTFDNLEEAELIYETT